MFLGQIHTVKGWNFTQIIRRYRIITFYGNKIGHIKMKLISSHPHKGEYSPRDHRDSAKTRGQWNWNLNSYWGSSEQSHSLASIDLWTTQVSRQLFHTLQRPNQSATDNREEKTAGSINRTWYFMGLNCLVLSQGPLLPRGASPKTKELPKGIWHHAPAFSSQGWAEQPQDRCDASCTSLLSSWINSSCNFVEND